MEIITTHDGTVTAVDEGRVEVRVTVESACGSCEAHGKCGFAESKDKTMYVDTPEWKDYKVGDPVTVGIQSGNGLKAVLIAYIIPAALLLAAFAVFNSLHLSEGWVAILTLAIVALYGLFLYGIRARLQRKFSISISHKR